VKRLALLALAVVMREPAGMLTAPTLAPRLEDETLLTEVLRESR
jgi:hypothetical protein